jgi:hypothetical protein
LAASFGGAIRRRQCHPPKTQHVAVEGFDQKLDLGITQLSHVELPAKGCATGMSPKPASAGRFVADLLKLLPIDSQL